MQEYRNMTTEQKREVSIQWEVELYGTDYSGGKGVVFDHKTFEYEPTDEEVLQFLADRISEYSISNATLHADVRKVYTIIDELKPEKRR